MYVSMIKTDPIDGNSLDEIKKAWLVILEEDVPKEAQWYGGAVIEVTDVVYPCVAYVDYFKKCSKELNIDNTLLHVIAMCGVDCLHTLHDAVPTIIYDKDRKKLYGTFNDKPFMLDLLKDTATVSRLHSLCTLYNKWHDAMIKLGLSTSTGTIEFIFNNLENICDKIYHQYQITNLDLNKFTKIPVFDMFEVSFIDTYRSFGNRNPVAGTTVVRNVEYDEVVYIGGLPSKMFKQNLTELKSKSNRFHKYVEISLDDIGLWTPYTTVDTFYDEVAKKLENEVMVYDMEEIDPDELKTFENEIKWLLLHMMDHELVNKWISHALPIRVEEDENGNLSATFNYIGRLENNPFFNGSTFSKTFKPFVIDNIMRYYNRSRMFEYKRYIGKRPDIQIIIAGINADMIQKFKEEI